MQKDISTTSQPDTGGEKITPVEARAGQRRGLWKILVMSMALGILGLLIVGMITAQ